MNPLDILQADLTNVDLTPTLPRNRSEVPVRVTSIKMEQSQAGDDMIVISVQTTAECEAHNKPTNINPGYPCTYTIALKPVDKNGNSREEMIQRDMARFREATTGDKAGTFAPLEQYIGLECIAAFKIEESDQYGTQCRISRFKPMN